VRSRGLEESGIRTVIPLQISGLSGHLLTDGFRKGDGLVGALMLELVGLVVFLQLGSSGGQSRRGDPHGHGRSRVQASVKPGLDGLVSCQRCHGEVKGSQCWTVPLEFFEHCRARCWGAEPWTSFEPVETGQSALSGTSRGWRYHSEVESGWYTFRDFQISRG
jgi:hypothetical protein